MNISLVICTYNRADILKQTLPFIESLYIPKEMILEVVIVNNNSTDKTLVLLSEFIKKKIPKVEIKYVFEEKQGLSHARNKGYLKSKGEYVAYIDDECILPQDWLANAFEIIKSSRPAFLGGPFLGKYIPGSSSKWFKESFGDSHMLQYDLPNGEIKNRYLSGGNLFVRRDVFEKVGVFDTTLGMSGNQINYGEEDELQMRFVNAFPNEVVWYDDSVFLWHLIRDEKMTLSFLFKDALVRGRSAAKLKNLPRYKLIHAPFYLLYFLLKAIFSFVFKGIRSVFSDEHFFVFLYDDYKYGTWRGIGSSIYKTKKLFGLVA